jgi:hypothetical protein
MVSKPPRRHLLLVPRTLRGKLPPNSEQVHHSGCVLVLVLVDHFYSVCLKEHCGANLPRVTSCKRERCASSI